MKRSTLILGVMTILLAACTGGGFDRQTYDVELDTDDTARRVELLMALEEVTIRRLQVMGIQAPVTTAPEGDGGVLTVSSIKSKDDAKGIKGILAEPFTFDIRYEVIPEAEEGVQPVPVWEKTSLDGSYLTWVEVTPSANGTAMIELQFNEAGLEILNSLLQEEGKNTLGIFVRDFLVSKVTVVTEKKQERILIPEVPTVEMANVFAEDVNVGLHVKLTPR